MDALALIARQIERCEDEGVTILCCPEAILGGLADYSRNPAKFAIAALSLSSVLRPLASQFVTTIVGFTEQAEGDRLYNSAAVFHRGTVAGVYRKLHPAINRSVYQAGSDVPVFKVDSLRFGIVICNDSNYPEPARLMAARGATALFVPTNNGLPFDRNGEKIVRHARSVDIARAVENGISVIRADVAGRNEELLSYGSSGIVDSSGSVVRTAQPLNEELLVVEIDNAPRCLSQ